MIMTVHDPFGLFVILRLARFWPTSFQDILFCYILFAIYLIASMHSKLISSSVSGNTTLRKESDSLAALYTLSAHFQAVATLAHTYD